MTGIGIMQLNAAGALRYRNRKEAYEALVCNPDKEAARTDESAGHICQPKKYAPVV